MSKWFYSKSNQTHGPFSAAELKNVAAEGLLKSDDVVWPEGGTAKDGLPAEAVLDFARLPPVKPIHPPWLEDVAKQEHSGPVPPPAASADIPDWLADLRLWYALEMAPAGSAGSRPKGCARIDEWCDLEKLTGLPHRAGKVTQIAPPLVSPTPPLATPVMPVGQIVAKVAPAFPAPVATPVIPAAVESPPKADLLAERAVSETGIDPRTGQVIDPVQFQKWKQQQASSTAVPGTPATASLMGVFRQARTAIERWVDDDDHRHFIIAGDMEPILNNSALAEILQEYADYGPVMKDKLLKHLAFVVENRKNYFAACPQ